MHAQLALAGSAVVVAAWNDGTVRVPRVLVRVSRDGGVTFAPAAVASEGADAATFPVLAARPGRVALAWTTEPAGHAEHAQHPDEKNRKAHMPLPSVGARQVLVREAAID